MNAKTVVQRLGLLLFFIVSSGVKTNAENIKFSDFFTLAKSFSSALNDVSLSPMCKKHYGVYLQGLEKLELWAVRMYDSAGKWPSGVLNGNVHQNGDYTQCMTIDERLSDDHITGKFCRVVGFAEALDRNSSLDKIMHLVHSYNIVRSGIEDNYHPFPSFNELSWSICVPASCTADEIYKLVNRIVAPYNHSFGLDIKIKKLSEDACLTNFPPSTLFYKILFVIIILTPVIFGIIGSICEANWYQSQNKLVQFFCSFSFKTNFQLLMQTGSMENDISCLNGIRGLFSLYIYVSHKSLFGLFRAYANRTEIAELIIGPQSMIMRTFWNHVDTFVILSALLTSYYMTMKLKQGKKINVILMYIKRYLKFGPLYLIIVIFMRGFTLPRGPQYLRMYSQLCQNCRTKPLWKQIFLVDNVDGISNMCYPPAHQLFTDWQIYLVSPFVIILFYRMKRHALMIFITSIIALQAHKFFFLYTNNVPPIFPNGATLNEMLKGADAIYINPVQRFAPYLIGFYFGHFLNMNEIIVLSKMQRIFGWFVALSCAYYSIFGLVEFSDIGYKYEPLQPSIYGSLQPLTWGTFVCWIILVCYCGYAPKLNDFLSWKGFVIFSRISYPFYILQFPILYWTYTVDQTAGYNLNLVDLNELLVLAVISMFFTITLLIPLVRISNIFSKSGIDKPKEPNAMKEKNKLT